jgi:hypothetical protein
MKKLILSLILVLVSSSVMAGGRVEMTGVVTANDSGNRNGIIEILPDDPKYGRNSREIFYNRDVQFDRCAVLGKCPIDEVEVGNSVNVVYKSTPNSDYDGELISLDYLCPL